MKTRCKKKIDEASNSFALFLIMAPVIFGAFGVGLDISRNVFIRTELQNALDMATVGGAGVTVVGNAGNVRVDTDNAMNTVDKVYAENRAQGPALSCWGDNHAIPQSNLRRCWKVKKATVNPQYISYSVEERSTNAFLQIIGVKYQKYLITSQARIKQAEQ